MAVTLRLSAGPLVFSEIKASNERGARIIDLFLEAYGHNIASMDNQEKADAFMRQMRRYILEVSNPHKEEKAVEQTRAEVEREEWSERALPVGL